MVRTRTLCIVCPRVLEPYIDSSPTFVVASLLLRQRRYVPRTLPPVLVAYSCDNEACSYSLVSDLVKPPPRLTPQPTRRIDIWVYLRRLPPRFLLIIRHSPSCSLLPAAPPFLPLRSTPSCNASPGPLPLKSTTSPVQAQVAPSERTSACAHMSHRPFVSAQLSTTSTHAAWPAPWMNSLQLKLASSEHAGVSQTTHPPGCAHNIFDILSRKPSHGTGCGAVRLTWDRGALRELQVVHNLARLQVRNSHVRYFVAR